MENYIKDQDKLKEYINVVERLDADKSYGLLEARVKKHKRIQLRRTVLRYAAIIAVVLAIPFAFYRISLQKQITTVSENNVIKPLSNKARIVLADGKQISLSATVDTNVLNKTGIKYDKDSETISYKTDVLSRSSAPKRVIVPRGAEINLKLSDGTKVYINSDSELEFPSRFTGRYRKVKMRGEAFFKVAKDKEHPFIVETSHVDIRVTGTEFNVKAYSEEDKIQTTLVEGGVDVYYGFDKLDKVSIKPSQQAEYSKRGEGVDVKDVDVNIYTAWLGQKFIFKDQTLEEIMTVLARWYDVEVFYQNNELRDIVFSAEVGRYDNINTILDCIEKTGDIDVSIKNKTVILREKFNK